MSGKRAAIPAVNRVLDELAGIALPRPLLLAVVRRELAAARAAPETPAPEQIIGAARAAAGDLERARLRPVINGTGVLIHTNLGRAPLGNALQQAAATAAGYTNLELELGAGTRGGRGAYVEQALAVLCATDRAIVVNNCAAALVLVVAALTSSTRPEIVISRGEMLQIGGGFRIPEMLVAAGAQLREVGTTNKTAVADYEAAVGERTGALLVVHRSNFVMEGFVATPRVEELAQVAATLGVPLVVDLGSGATWRTADAGLPHEPTPAEVLAAGAKVVCFSGDKLLGGPQAGVIAGDAALVDAMARHPLFRALRSDKVAFAVLQATLEALLVGNEAEQGPLLRQLIAVPAAVLHERAERLRQRLAAGQDRVRSIECQSRLGGGTLPTGQLPSVGLELAPAAGTADGPEQLAQRLRDGTPPVIGYINRGRVVVDLRTVLAEQDAALVAALGTALAAPAATGER